MAGVGAVRSLSEQDVPIAHADWEWNPDVFSVHVRTRQRLESPMVNEPGFVFGLSRFGATFRRKPVLFPCSDCAVWYVAKHKATLERHFHIPLSRFGIIEKILMKDKLYRFLESRGYPTPRTVYPLHRATVTVESGITYPCIVKPSQSHIFRKLFGRKVILVRNDTELRRALSLFQHYALDPCVQEIIPGDSSSVVSVGGYFDKHSRPIAMLTTRRIREFPLSFGTGSRIVTECLPEVAELATQIVASLSFHGIADIDFIEDKRDDKLKLIDFNPRCWGEVYISAKAGADIPLSAYLDTLGTEVKDTSQMDGVRWVDNVADVLAFFQEYRAGKASLSAFSRQFGPRQVYSTLTVKDPFPAFQEVWLYARLLMNSRARRKRIEADFDNVELPRKCQI